MSGIRRQQLSVEADPRVAQRWRFSAVGHIRIGSNRHKEMFCRMLLDTYDPYKPSVIPWPKLEDDA